MTPLGTSVLQEEDVSRLRRELDRERTEKEELRAANRGLKEELDRERNFREEDRRRDAVERALHRLKGFHANQKMVIIVLSRIAASHLSRGEGSPVITRAEIAKELGIAESTVGDALELFDRPDSPIRRWRGHRQGRHDDGTTFTKKTIAYELTDVSSGRDIIERMVTIGERLDPSTRERQTPATPAIPRDRRATNDALADPAPSLPPSVDVLVTFTDQNARTATDEGAPDPQAA